MKFASLKTNRLRRMWRWQNTSTPSSLNLGVKRLRKTIGQTVRAPPAVGWIRKRAQRVTLVFRLDTGLNMLFETDYPGAVAAFKGEAAFTLDVAVSRFHHVLSQLDDEQVWARPHAGMRAVGHGVLHVSEHLTQWITVGCDPDRSDRVTDDDRKDLAEHASCGEWTTAKLAEHLDSAVAHAKAVLAGLNKDHLLEARKICGPEVEVTGMGAVWHSVAHVQAHAQEAVYAARLLLGDAWRSREV